MKQFARDLLCLATAVQLWLGAAGCAVDADLPRVRVASVRRIFDNGEHNAFTDMVCFRGRFFLTFRSCPDGHGVHPTSSIIVMSSEGGQDWQLVHRFRVPKRDVRDPHFLVFKGRLFVYTGAWYCGDCFVEMAAKGQESYV